MIQAVPREFVSSIAPESEYERVPLDDIRLGDCQAVYQSHRGELRKYVALEKNREALSAVSQFLAQQLESVRELRALAEDLCSKREVLAAVVQNLDAESGILYKMLEHSGIEIEESELEDYFAHKEWAGEDSALLNCWERCKELSVLKNELEAELLPVEGEFRGARNIFVREDQILSRSRSSFVIDDYLARGQSVLFVPALVGIIMQVGFVTVLGGVVKAAALRLIRSRTRPTPELAEVDNVQGKFFESFCQGLEKLRRPEKVPPASANEHYRVVSESPEDSRF